MHPTEAGVPERIDFNRFAHSRRHRPIVHHCIHPGQSHMRTIPGQEIIYRIYPDFMESSGHQGFVDALDCGILCLDKIPILGRF